MKSEKRDLYISLLMSVLAVLFASLNEVATWTDIAFASVVVFTVSVASISLSKS